MFKRKLFKRALPIILSVAMIFQSMPATALAAESPVQETAADSETLDESTDTMNSDVSDDSASDASSSDENTSEDSAFEEKAPAEDNFEETSLEENTSSESESEQSSSEEKGSEESSSTEDSSTEKTSEEGSSEETTAPEETSTVVQTDSTEEMEGVDQKEDTAKPAAVLVDEDKLRSAVEKSKLHYDEEAKTVFALYDADKKNPFEDILKGAYYDDENEEDISFFYVELDGKENSDLTKQLHCTWKDADDKDLTGVPKNAGSYKLVIKLDAIDQVCKEAQTTLNFRIDQRNIMVNYDDVEPITPGTIVAEAIKAIQEDYQLKLTDISGNPQEDFLNKEAYVASCAVSIIRERLADGSTPKPEDSTLKPDEKIKSNEEYSVKLEITLKDKSNYTLSNTSRKLEVAAGVNTEIKANTIQTDGTNFGWTYGKPKEMAELIKEINPYVVESNTDTDSEEEQKIADAKFQYQWLDVDKKELEESAGDGTKIPEKVKDAGTYYLRISYTGEAGHYNASTIDITIVVSTADVYIGDIELESTNPYIEGTTVNNALQTIKSYKVYETGAAEKTDLMGNDKYFWGVSYNGDADENTQSYEPVFKIRRGQVVKDKDGNNSTAWEADYLKDTDRLIETEGEGDEAVQYKYRIEFSGKKAVYGENDAPVDINDSQKNYRVDVTEATRTANACELTVKAASGPVIDVSKILENEELNPNKETDKGSLKNPLTKVYDGDPLYEDKGAYKKATVKGDSYSSVSSTDLTYQWQKITGYTEIVNDDNSIDIDVKDTPDDYYNVEYASAPSNAGNYRLEIKYTDSKTGAVSKTAYVYYTIKKEDILIEPKSDVTAYYGETVSSYLADITAALRNQTQSTESESENKNLVDYTISDFTEGKEKGELANEAWLLSELKRREKEGNSALTWRVERKITEGDKAGSWYELQGNDVFVEGGEYRLTVYADWQTESNSLQNYNNRYELDFKNEQIEEEQTGEYKIQARYADKQSIAITPAQTQGIEVKFEVDWDKITQTTKVYDGETFDETMLAAVKSAVKAYNTKTGDPIDQADIIFGWEWRRQDSYGDYAYISNVGEKEAIHAGNYYLTLSVEKGDKYLGQKVTYNADFTDIYKTFVIMPAELTVTPKLKSEIKAGTQIFSTDSSANNAGNVKNIIESIEIDKDAVAEADKPYIIDKVRYYSNSEISYPYPVGGYGLELKITDKATGQLMSGYLKGNHSYNVRFDFDGVLNDWREWNDALQTYEYKFYGTDYTLKFATISFEAVRASSIVRGMSGELWSYDVAIQDSVTKSEKNNFTHTITPREGIPYNYYQEYNKENKKLGGNYFAVRIVAPLEYTDVSGAEDRVIYQSSIENAGGYICGFNDVELDGEGKPTHCKSITAVFDAAKIAESENGTSFEITWEEGFTETFTITVPKTLLMEDLQKAVLPKSLAFNGASAKMTVGEGQQLDLKITKTQMADIICVAYESSDEKVLTVSDSGYVTAIHTGKATVMAYAAYQDKEDGKIKPFIDAKGNYAKAAKLNITISKVSEVKKIKLEAHDTYAYIDYADVPDGYRREIYVLEGANIPAADFDAKIEAVKNGNYDTFDAHLFITATERDTKNLAGKKFWGIIDGLKPNTQYTVYVRNVSALRNFLNGEQIDASEFATAGKPVKLVTTKSQQKALNGYFKTAKGNQPVYGKTSVSKDEKSVVDYRGRGVNDHLLYIVDISAKSVKFDVEAKYWQKDQAEIDYADGGDYIWYPLALTKDQQKDYVNPKLTYYVTDDYSNSVPNDWKARGYVKAGNYYFRPTTTRAAIDKNGKISLKGSGSVWVFVYDAEQDIVSEPVELHISSTATSFAGKAIKMKVGTTVYLSDYLTYKQNNIKLSQYQSKNLSVTCEDEDGAFEILPLVDQGGQRIYDYYIKAKRPTSKPLDLVVSDKTVTANGGSDITIKLSASALDPVKSLKAYDVYDTEGSIRFDYASSSDPNLEFRIEVKDQTGRILKNELVDSSANWKEFYVKNEAYYKALYNHDYSEIYDGDKYEYPGFKEYNAKKKTWTYCYDLKNLDNLSLKRLSSYTVSVTAVYDGYDAKTASTKIKTTNIPASKTNAVAYDDQGKDTKNDGGDGITVYKNNNGDGNQLNTYPLLKSGNTYTLDFTGADSNARNMKTDTLIWKSSNTKVATVKANQGTYTATLKAVKKGTTQITVTSKITKKIVARWTIFVNAVGEANGYFGDNIFQGSNSDTVLADKLGADLLTLNNSMTFTLANGEKKWLAFKAPSDGSYSVTAKGGSFIAYDSDSRPLGYLENTWNNKEMEKGETIYFLLTAANSDKLKKTFVQIIASGIQYTPLSIGVDGTKVQGGKTVTFIAPEKNVYTFSAFDKNGEDVSESVLNNTTMLIQKDRKQTLSIGGNTSEEYIIKVTPAELMKDGTTIALKKGETKYYQFTADEPNEYTIYTTGATEKIVSGAVCGIDYNNSLYVEEDATPKKSSETDTDPKNVGFSTKKLEKKSITYIALTAGDKDTTATFKVEKAPKIGESFTIAEANGTRTVVYIVNKDGEYRFRADGTKAIIESIEVNDNYNYNGADSWQGTLHKGDYVKLTVNAEDANTSVTVSCTPIEPVTVKADEAGKPVKVTTGLSQKVEFTSLENAWYAFNFDNNKVRVNEITSNRSTVASGTEFYAKAGEVRTFTVSTYESTEQTANITITKVTVEKLADTTKTLTKGKPYRYYWTAENEGLYDFAFTVTGAEIAYSKTEGVEDESLDTVDGYYSKGDTFYLTIKTNDSADGSFKAVIAKQDAEELTSNVEKGITVGANASKWVSFTSKWSEKVRYQYSKADADGFAFYESTGLDDEYTEEVSFTGSKVLRPGQKVYYKVVNNNATEKTVKLKIAPVLAKEINVAAGTGAVRGSDTIKAGANGWYHFHAANAGRYDISVTSTAGDATTEISNYKIYSDLTAEDYNDDNRFWIMEAEKDFYINVSNNTAADAEITVTVTDMAAAAAVLELDASKPLNLKKGVTQYLLFNAKETARYTLKAVDKDNKAYELPVTYYINRNYPEGTNTPISAISLDAGDTILFAITTSADVDVTVTLTKENVIELTNEAVPQTIRAGQTLYFRAKIGARDSRYFIETSEVAEGLTLTYESVTGWMNWNNGYADFVPGSRQEEVVFGLTASSTFENTKTFKIKKGIVSPTSIKAETPVESSELTASHKVWYSFTPEKAGRYSIKANGASVSRYNNGVTGSGTFVSIPSEFLVTDEMVGKEVIYAVYHTDAAAKKVSLSIAEITAAEFTSNKYTVDITKIELGENIWLHFKAASDGRYTFNSSDLAAVGAMQWFEAIDANYRDSVKYFGTEYCLNAEEEYYIAIPYNTKAEKNFDIQVNAITDSTAEAVSVSETAKEFEMKAGEVKWLKFTPTKTANYQFKLTNVAYGYIEQYDNIAASECTRYIYGSTYAFAANKTVYLKLIADYTLPEGSKPSIQITAEDMQTLTEGNNTISNIAENETYKYAFFTPSESAVYSFELTDSTNCSVEISVDGISYNTLYLGNDRKYALDKEHPAYIKVEAYDTSASAEIMIQKEFSVGEMRVGDSKDVTLTSDSNMAFYQFTAEEDGVYIFETDSKNTVYVNISGSIENALLNPDNYNSGRSGSFVTELKKGTVKYIRVAEYKGNLSSSDAFTLTCKKAKEISFTGVDSINLNLKNGEPVLVRWTAGAKGNYQFGFDVTDGSSVKYKYYESKNITAYPNSYSTSRGNSWNQYETSSLNGRNLILEASERTQVEVSAQIVPRSISVGRTETVELDSSKRSEEFNFYMNGNATYIFYTTEADSALNSYIIDPDTNDRYDGTTYNLGNDRYWIYSTPSEYGKTYKFHVETSTYSSDSFKVSVYYYKYDSFELNSAGLEISDCNVQSSGENWYQFRVNKTDWYGFGADYSIYMNLYRCNGSRLELLGTKASGYNKIYSTLQEGDIVLLQTYYGGWHGSGSYNINVTYGLQQTTSSWTIYGDSDSQNVRLDSGWEQIMPLDFNGLSNNTKYAFALTSSYDSENVRMTLYQVEEDSALKVAQGHNFSYEIDPNCSYELRVSNYSSSYWNGTVTAQKEYPYEAFELSLDNNAQEVTVIDGSEARFYFTVPEDGSYLFYGTADSYCNNYAELWINDIKELSTGYGGDNGQFSINRTLYADDTVELRTYMNSHNSDRGTYTVHIEKVPEGYSSLTKMNIGGTSSSTYVSALAAGETKEYRFIAPVSNDNGTEVSYIFYSQMNNTSEGIELTANVSLASEVSAYALGTVQKDDKGNFYNVSELIPGRPYIFSITNNGNSDLNSTTYVYAYEYTETDGGKIGGSNQNELTELSIASGENWLSYTAEEDGIYTFTISEPSNYGYMYLYQVEDSQLTQIPQSSSYGTYFSSGLEAKIANMILNKGDQVLVRIYQSSHQELTCKVQPSWAAWNITSVENDSSTIGIMTNTSDEEGKVWLTFGEDITEGKYTISATSTSATLKLYKDRKEVVSTSDSTTEEQQSNTVTFEYQPRENAVYQLGIATTQSSVNLTITKEPESETPDEGENSDDSGDNSGEGDNTGEENNASSDI